MIKFAVLITLRADPLDYEYRSVLEVLDDLQAYESVEVAVLEAELVPDTENDGVDDLISMLRVTH